VRARGRGRREGALRRRRGCVAPCVNLGSGAGPRPTRPGGGGGGGRGGGGGGRKERATRQR